MDGVKENVKEIYFELKNQLLEYDNTLIFNPRKYYISIIKTKNISYITLRKSKVRIVVMMSYEEVKKRVKKLFIGELSESVQKFWNGPSCEIKIESLDNIDELISVIKEIVDIKVSI